MSKKKFIDLCATGNTLVEEIDDFIDMWHDGDYEEELFEFLGMTQIEYDLWLQDSSILPFIVTAHRNNIDIEELIRQRDEENNLPIAARMINPQNTFELIDWLKKHVK